MKNIVAFPLAWFLYFVGDMVSRILDLFDNEYWAAFWYPVYNNLMIGSSGVQVWAGGKESPWPWGA